jgi:hypothetical protein
MPHSDKQTPSAGLALLFIFILGSLSLPICIQAGEGGGNLYPGGNEDFMAGALPPAGTKIFINYFESYDADRLKDNNGNNTDSLRLRVVCDAFRFIDVTKVRVLSGDLIAHVIVPMIYEHADFSAGATSIADQGQAGMGDIEFGPGIAWHPSQTFHHVLAFDAVAPSGQYDKNAPVNIGRNYWGLDPIWAFTYLGGKDSPIPGLETSAKFMYWFNTRNSATDYRSGDEFSFDYLVGYHSGDWGLGANGHFLYQTSDDVQSGHSVAPDGNRGRYFSLGPALQYKLGKDLDITLKYQSDLYAQNKPAGDHYWMKIAWLF